MSGPFLPPSVPDAAPEPPEVPAPVPPVPQPLRAPRRRPPRLAIAMFLLTVLTTLDVGVSLSTGVSLPFAVARGEIELGDALALLPSGIPYVLALLGFFVAHEMGHYLACRRYGVDCTVPYFLPVPSLVSLIGTLGALIRIRGRIPTRRALFDIGIAGPLAGFAVAVPLLVVGTLAAPLGPPGAAPRGTIVFGDSLLTWALGWLLRPDAREASLYLDPIYLAGWVGVFATALNLLPAGQLDGGHILYALSPRAHARMAWLVPAFLIALAATRVLRYGEWEAVLLWVIWSALILLFGRRHPPPAAWEPQLGPGRLALALGALAILVLCFMPVPLSFVP